MVIWDYLLDEIRVKITGEHRALHGTRKGNNGVVILYCPFEEEILGHWLCHTGGCHDSTRFSNLGSDRISQSTLNRREMGVSSENAEVQVSIREAVFSPNPVRIT